MSNSMVVHPSINYNSLHGFSAFMQELFAIVSAIGLWILPQTCINSGKTAHQNVPDQSNTIGIRIDYLVFVDEDRLKLRLLNLTDYT